MPQVGLTAEGRLRAEGGEGIIGDYQRGAQIVVIDGDGNQVAVGHGQTVTQTDLGPVQKEEIVWLLDQADAALKGDTTLADTDRLDALADIDSMRTQLAKETPNRPALSALAAGLPAVGSVAEIAEEIRHFVH
jgi:hypothetical protein